MEPITSLLSDMKPLLVLIWDGDPERRQEIAALLKQAGHQVALAPTARDVEAAAGNYDLVVLDPASTAVSGQRQATDSAEPRTPDSLQEAERRHLAFVLRHTSCNKRKAAHLLGISRSTLLNKVRKYGLEE
jgi:DNA-binding NtrC family response regulator